MLCKTYNGQFVYYCEVSYIKRKNVQKGAWKMNNLHEVRKQDRRIAKTKKLLKEAIIELMGKDHIDHITVSTLCEHVDISRNTFYYHYAHIGELIDDIIADNIQLLDALSTGVTDPQKSICELYEFMAKHKNIYMGLLIKNTNVNFLNALKEHTKVNVRPALLSLNPDVSEERMEVISFFIADVFLVVFLRWLQQGYEKAPANEVGLLIQLLDYGVQTTMR